MLAKGLAGLVHNPGVSANSAIYSCYGRQKENVVHQLDDFHPIIAIYL